MWFANQNSLAKGLVQKLDCAKNLLCCPLPLDLFLISFSLMFQCLREESTRTLVFACGLDEFSTSNTMLNGLYMFPLNGNISAQTILPITLVPKRFTTKTVIQEFVSQLDALRTVHTQYDSSNNAFNSCASIFANAIGDNKGVCYTLTLHASELHFVIEIFRK